MSTYHEEAAAAHGAMNPTWRVAFEDGFTGEVVEVVVRAAERQEAINKASYRLDTTDLSKPAPTLYFKTAQLEHKDWRKGEVNVE